MNHIRVLLGDKVRLVLDSYGGKARIIKRLWLKIKGMLSYCLQNVFFVFVIKIDESQGIS
jgi:hypothetical protein